MSPPGGTSDVWKYFRKIEKKYIIVLFLSGDTVVSRAKYTFNKWEDMKSVFQKLYAMSRKYLIVPGTSVPSERLFSKAGATMSEARNRLTGSRLDKLLFLSDCSETDWGF